MFAGIKDVLIVIFAFAILILYILLNQLYKQSEHLEEANRTSQEIILRLETNINENIIAAQEHEAEHLRLEAENTEMMKTIGEIIENEPEVKDWADTPIPPIILDSLRQ